MLDPCGADVPQVSVLMPARNAAPFVAESIGSIRAQSFADWELVVVDDGSSDSTPAILAQIARHDSRVRVLRRSKGNGVADALNEGLRICRSDLVVRMDADDVARPDRLARLVETMMARPDIAVCGSALRVKERPIEYWGPPETHDAIVAAMLFENAVYHPTVAFHKAQVLEVGGYDPRYEGAEDYALWLAMLRVPGMRFANLRAPLLRYRRHPGVDRASYRRRQAVAAAAARASHLAQLGLAPSDVELACHEDLSRSNSASDCVSSAALDRWLGRLYDMISRQSTDGGAAVTRELERRWMAALARKRGQSTAEIVAQYRAGRFAKAPRWGSALWLKLTLMRRPER